jgi:hypothetical protein
MQNAGTHLKSGGWEAGSQAGTTGLKSGNLKPLSGFQPLELKPVWSCDSGAEDLPDGKTLILSSIADVQLV